MKLQKVEKLDKNVISSIKIYKRPFTAVIRIFRLLYIYINMYNPYTCFDYPN